MQAIAPATTRYDGVYATGTPHSRYRTPKKQILNTTYDRSLPSNSAHSKQNKNKWSFTTLTSYR